MMHTLPADDKSGEQSMVAWNLRHLVTRGNGGGKSTEKTIEWRQPPAVKNVRECLNWLATGLSFVQAARGWEDIGNEIKSKYSPDTEGLHAFLNERGIGVTLNIVYVDSTNPK
jgi:hypothetical protein